MAFEGVHRPKMAPADGQAVVIRESDAPALTEHIPDRLLAAVARFQSLSLTVGTQERYRGNWDKFVGWCDLYGYNALPAHPKVVAAYLAEHAELLNGDGEYEYQPSYLDRWVSALNWVHETNGYIKPGNFPDVSRTMTGIRRDRATAARKAKPLMLDEVRRIIETADLHTFPYGVTNTRDTTIVLLGFAGAFRRSEIAGLQFRDVVRHPQDGLHITLRQSKTDQEGHGLVTALPYGTNPVTCPVCAFARWTKMATLVRTPARGLLIRELREQRIDEHICHQPLPELDLIEPTRPLFQPLSRNGRVTKPTPIAGSTVMKAVTDGVKRIGLDPTAYSGHSLRAGFVTQAKRNGATDDEVMRQTHHVRVETVRTYDRQYNPLINNAVTKVGL